MDRLRLLKLKNVSRTADAMPSPTKPEVLRESPSVLTGSFVLERYLRVHRGGGLSGLWQYLIFSNIV